ncbi:MAG: DUF799 family lipoprotein [Pseudomonadota bacterium]|nr:DUF799 family lipoprotein [Pseudomonadota bacterium]
MKRVMLIGLSLLLLSACQTREPMDYSALQANMPRSILVLPPVNQTTEVQAPYTYLSTVSTPLAERGFYVFPVAVVEAMMRENGLQDPYEMHQVPMAKLNEVIDPDAVLYVSIEEWGQKYQVLSSKSVVSVKAALKDADSGELLWASEAYAVDGESQQNNTIGMLIEAAVKQVANSLVDKTHEVSKKANYQLFNGQRGVLPGPYFPQTVK